MLFLSLLFGYLFISSLIETIGDARRHYEP